MIEKKINKVAVIVAAIPYVLLGYPWFSIFRDSWFEGGGLTEQQLINGPGFVSAFTVAFIASIVMSYVLAFLIIRTGEQSIARGIKIGILVWLGFIVTLLGTRYILRLVVWTISS